MFAAVYRNQATNPARARYGLQDNDGAEFPCSTWNLPANTGTAPENDRHQRRSRVSAREKTTEPNIYTADMGALRMWIKVGRENPMIDTLIGEIFGTPTEWAWISAWTGFHCGEGPTLEERERHAALLRASERYSYLPGSAIGPVENPESFPTKEGLFIVGIPAAKALELARRFRQREVIVGHPGGAPIRLACDATSRPAKLGLRLAKSA
jgi:hypothetical protein